VHRILAIALLVGCADKTGAGQDSGDPGNTDGGSSDGGSSDGGGSDGGGSDGGGSDGGSSDSVDEALLRAAIAGETDAATALAEVARSGGLPVETDDGYLFACLCGGGDWLLAGDHEGWVGQAMTRSGELSWIEVEIAAPDGSLYKFTNGSDWMSDPLGRRYGTDDFGEYSLVRASAAHLERWYDVSGYGLVGRDLQVWVPQDGVFTHTVYAHDGQNLFDPGAFWGGWHLQDSVPGGMLVVGIDNTDDRMEEYTHTTDVLHGDVYGGDGDAYADLVEGVIRPLIEGSYGSADAVGLLGSSLGGLISFHIAMQYPGSYDFAASMSGTMGWGSFGANNPTMIERYRDQGHAATALYVDSGGNGDCYDSDGDGIDDDDPSASDNYCENIQLRDVLTDVGYVQDVDLWHWHEPDAEHNEYAWGARVDRPLSIFAGL
jgi:Putative esterase